jgi:hypothetical protein
MEQHPCSENYAVDMLNERPNPACGRCYEQEESGFFSADVKVPTNITDIISIV